MMEVYTRDGYDFVRVPTEDQLRWAGVPPRFVGARWSPGSPAMVAGVGNLHPVSDPKIRKSLEWLMGWSSEDKEKFVVLVGPRGRGKTTYAAATIWRVAHLKPRWVEWPKLVADVADSWRNQGEGFVLDPIIRCSFLVLDDFGKELTGSFDAQMTGWQKRVAFEVINGRYTRMLPTIVTTELSLEEMGARLDAAITSRLAGDGIRIDLSAAPDYRVED